MSFSANSSSSSHSEINVTPLIDVLLVLLIIFMVIVPQHQQGLDSSVPQGKASATTALPPVTVQVVSTAGSVAPHYLVNQRLVASTELAATLKGLLASREDRTLIVQADRSLSYQQVASIVGLSRESGADRVSLAGLPPR